MRATAGSVVLVALVLVVSGVALSALLRRSAVLNVRTTAELLAADVGARVEAGTASDALPEPSDDEDRAMVQVVDPGGRVLASTPELEGEAAMALSIPPAEVQTVRILRNPPFEDDEEFLVVARRVASPEGTRVVYVASSLQDVDEMVGRIDRGLLWSIPLLLLGVGLTSWVVVGRALRPVEAMRAEVANITATALDRRVAEPAVDDEIGRLARTMNAMLDRLEAAHLRQRRFVADASHELRSPLASTRAQLEVGLTRGAATHWPSTAAEVLEENQRMERLVENLLLMARVEESTGPARRDLVDLDELVLAEVTRVRARGRVRVDITWLSAGRVLGDPDQLRQVVRNLLENAERHARGEVRVELQAQGSTVELLVADDGDGIPSADRDRVFERFTRLDEARAREEGGTGLGLAIAREVVEAHHGVIAVVDSSRGARIAVRLPCPSGT